MKNHDWEDYEEAANRGPLALAVKVIVGFTILFVLIFAVSYAFSWCGSAANTVQKEVGSDAMLQKYMWLKEAHAQLDKKQADVKVYQTRLKSMDDMYKDVPRAKWAREDREQYNVWSSEVAGIKASYNDLAAQYNAKMAEMNWRFTNVGELPQGATETLPREYAPYMEQ